MPQYRHANLLFLSVVLGVLAFKGLNGITTFNTVDEVEDLKTELKLDKAVSLDMETPKGPFIVLSIFFAPNLCLKKAKVLVGGGLVNGVCVIGNNILVFLGVYFILGPFLGFSLFWGLFAF